MTVCGNLIALIVLQEVHSWDADSVGRSCGAWR